MALTAALAVVTMALLGVIAVRADASHGPHGTNFGAADTGGAPAYTGPKAIWAGACDTSSPSTSNGGVGTPPPARAHCIDHGQAYYPADVQNPELPRETTFQPGFVPDWRLDPFTQAGGHPDMTVSVWFQRSPDTVPQSQVWIQTDGDPKSTVVKLPPGIVGNPNALPKCPSALARTTPATCPPETQVGVATLTFAEGGAPAQSSVVPIWNMEPRDGKTAELLMTPGVKPTLFASVPIVAKLRSDGDFGIDTMALDLPGGFPLMGTTVTIWGVPWAESHDNFRPAAGYRGSPSVGGVNDEVGGMPEAGLPGGIVNLTDSAFPDGSLPQSQEPQPYQEDWGPIRPFLSLMTECDPVAPVTTVELTSYQNPDVLKSYPLPADAPVTGCDDVPFDPDISLTPTSNGADAPSGLSVELEVPQNDDPPAAVESNPDDVTGAPAHWKSDEGLATAQIEQAVVKLPAGVSVNPAASAGLQGCSDAELGLGTNDPIACPDGSKVGTVEVETPLLDDPLSGVVILREPRSTDPTSGDMFRLALVVKSDIRGVLVKIPGSTVADPVTGQLTTTFEDNPRLTFSRLSLELKAGPRGILALPQKCGSYAYDSSLSPWTAKHGAGGPLDVASGIWTINQGCANPFGPFLSAGMSQTTGGGPGVFSFDLTRPQGDQFLSGLTSKLPQGLLASLKGIPLCTNAQAAAAACPAASRIGMADAGAGSGTPFFLEKKGDVYLTEGYKGAPYGLATVVPVEAGPFRGQWALTPIVVRQALHVDRSTAEVTAVSDPFPQIWHGIPLRAREVIVSMDRPGFMRNPTDCSPKAIETTITSVDGASVNRTTPFQASGCGALAFKPKIGIRLTGKKQTRTNGHPGVRAKVTQAPGQAGISHVEVRLPKSLALDPDNAKALCEYADGIKPDIESHCPSGSIVGRARAVSPLLNRPLVGNVYFVKNQRLGPNGNVIRTLPMIVVALRGEIAINLKGESNAIGGKLVNTFANVPDAPVSQFNLNINGGKNGILVVTRTRRGLIDICARRQVAEADVDAHNGRRADQDVTLKRPCGKAANAKAKANKRARANRKARARR